MSLFDEVATNSDAATSSTPVEMVVAHQFNSRFYNPLGEASPVRLITGADVRKKKYLWPVVTDESSRLTQTITNSNVLQGENFAFQVLSLGGYETYIKKLIPRSRARFREQFLSGEDPGTVSASRDYYVRLRPHFIEELKALLLAHAPNIKLVVGAAFSRLEGDAAERMMQYVGAAALEVGKYSSDQILQSKCVRTGYSWRDTILRTMFQDQMRRFDTATQHHEWLYDNPARYKHADALAALDRMAHLMRTKYNEKQKHNFTVCMLPAASLGQPGYLCSASHDRTPAIVQARATIIAKNTSIDHLRRKTGPPRIRFYTTIPSNQTTLCPMSEYGVSKAQLTNYMAQSLDPVKTNKLLEVE